MTHTQEKRISQFSYENPFHSLSLDIVDSRKTKKFYRRQNLAYFYSFQKELTKKHSDIDELDDPYTNIKKIEM